MADLEIIVAAYESDLADLQAQNTRLREWLIEERMPNYCTGTECGCAGRLKEARAVASIKFNKEIDKALTDEKKGNANG